MRRVDWASPFTADLFVPPCVARLSASVAPSACGAGPNHNSTAQDQAGARSLSGRRGELICTPFTNTSHSQPQQRKEREAYYRIQYIHCYTLRKRMQTTFVVQCAARSTGVAATSSEVHEIWFHASIRSMPVSAPRHYSPSPNTNDPL